MNGTRQGRRAPRIELERGATAFGMQSQVIESKPARRRFLARLAQSLGVAASVPLLPAATSHASDAQPSSRCAEDHVQLPGRLGNPQATLATDGRVDPRILEVLKASRGLEPFPHGLTTTSTYEECLEFIRQMEDSLRANRPQLLAAMPAFPGVVASTETIKGVDGNDIKLYIDQPKVRTGDLPCVFHTHGGGMCFLTAEHPTFVRLRKSLAATGMIVVGVEFRNGGGILGNHPFPSGLNDCASGAAWAHRNRAALGISSIIIAGESGGGNLALATVLKANQEGWVEAFDGVYAIAPMISGLYVNPPPELVSLVENNRYLGDMAMMRGMMKVYDPQDKHITDPLAWPYHASKRDLEGLPPHIVTVYDLDPIRDEGLIFARKLLAAGVPAIARTLNGVTHAADLSMPDVVPDLFEETIRSIHGFAGSFA